MTTTISVSDETKARFDDLRPAGAASNDEFLSALLEYYEDGVAPEYADTDAGILELLADGRITPRYAAAELDRQQPYISQRLKRLLEHGHVRRVDRGLYELTDDPRGTADD